MAVMGVSSIAPAFPRIRADLGISRTEVGLLISVFTLPGIFFSPVIGVLADRWGRKKVLVPSLLLFGCAGGFCALAGSFRMLLVLRALQGLGASALGTVNVTILGDLYSGKRRTVMMGYNAGVLNIGTASYPAIGGALALISWRSIFMLPLLAIPLGFGILFLLRSPEPKNSQDFRLYLKDALRSMRSRRVAGIFIVGMATFIVLYGSFMTYMPFVLDDSFDISSLTIGLILSITSISRGA